MGIMLNVREKLSGRRWPPNEPARLDASSIAILSARLLLDLSPMSSNARKYEDELIRSHLRILYSVRQDRQVMVTGSAPEPLVAEAAAQIMHHRIGSNGNKQPYMDLWNLVATYIDDGLLAQGTIGELIGRILSILAMDTAICALTEQCELKYQTPVPVAAYYRALLTDDAWEVLRRSIPANRTNLSESSAKTTFERAFDGAFFHFSHYAKANDATPINDRFTWALWLRGTAILCQLNQELTNRALPIYFSKHGMVGPNTMSIALEQDKAGQSVDPVNVGVQSAEILKVFSPGHQLPYIATVHCYALTGDKSICMTEPSRYALRNQGNDQEAPRYQIDFQGLDAYRNLTESLKTDIRRMIDSSKNSLFNHHPRAYGLPLVRQMLPLLTGHPAATSWFGGLKESQEPLQVVAGPSSKGEENQATQGKPAKRRTKKKGRGSR